MKRSATANWQGSGKDGVGHLSTQSTVLNKSNYSYKTRFEDGIGTNPEELMAAAHAGCFSMKLSFVLQAAGFVATEINTECAISLENGAITKSELTLRAIIPGIDEATFQQCATEAKLNCPVSKAYNCEITLDAQLISA